MLLLNATAKQHGEGRGDGGCVWPHYLQWDYGI